METIKIKLHSSVDLITNSSTVIFTYSEGSLSAVKELVNEMLQVFDKTETFDDIFYAGVFCDNEQYLEDSNCPEEFQNEDWKENQEKIQALKLSIMKNEIAKPEWMIKVEESGDYNEYQPHSDLELIPKDEKYSKLANKLLSYLYSTDHEATYDG